MINMNGCIAKQDIILLFEFIEETKQQIADSRAEANRAFDEIEGKVLKIEKVAISIRDQNNGKPVG